MNLPLGRDHAITYGELAERLNIPRRSVEEAIRQMRLSGYPIITGSEGVWLSDDADEVFAAAQALSRRLVTQYRTVRAIRATARRMRVRECAQEELWPAA